MRYICRGIILDKQTVNKSIKTVIKKIDENSFIIHAESDIQAMIYCELVKNNNKIKSMNLKDHQNKKYNNIPVHTEYYFERNEKGKFTKGNRIDLVVYNENDMCNINTDYQRIKKDKEYLVKLDHVIEIKFEKGLGGKNKDNFENSIIEQDIKKLQRFHKLHKNYSNHESKLHFVYIRRLWKPDKQLRKRIGNADKKIDNACKKSPKITLHQNDKQFLNPK